MPLTTLARCRIPVGALLLAGLLASSAQAAVDPIGATKVFAEARTICTRDGGALWGKSLCGPMLLVDPTDRSLAANQADAGGAFEHSGPVFTGTLGPAVVLANTSVSWSGTHWSEILWPLPEDAQQRHVMLAHEMFHRIQPALGMGWPEGDNRQLDTLQGRYLLQLEWRALAKALRATTAADRRTAIADAVLFRRERYRRFPNAAAEEAHLEWNEGVAEYTGVRLGLQTPQARVEYALRDLSTFVSAPSYVRSFAYATGPAYGLLLDQADPAWRHQLGSGQRLDQLLASALRLKPPAFATLPAREKVYDDGSLYASEVRHAREKRAQLAALKARLVDGPVLTLPLKHSSYQFKPQTLLPLGDFGTVYPTLRLVDDWGVLEVDDGALMGGHVAAVSAVGFDPLTLKGDGWHLTLNKGWSVVPGTRQGDFLVKRTRDAGH